MEMVLLKSISRIMEFEYHSSGKSYDPNLYEKEVLKLYNRMLIKYTNLIVKLQLEDTTCIVILLAKIQNLVTS